MFSLRLDRWLDYLTGPQLLLGIVWLGMVCVTVTLLLMMVTRWGQSQPLKKCVFLSLLTHALLATYATTIEIVGATPRESFVRATIIDTEPSAGNDSTTESEAGGRSAKPWDVFSEDPPPQERAELDRPEPTPMLEPFEQEQPVSAVLPSKLPAMATELTPAEPASLTDIEPAAPHETAAEEPIEAPAASRRQTRDPALVQHSGPAKTEAAKTSGPPALSATSPGLPGELSNAPTLPRLVDLPTARPGPVSSDLSTEMNTRSNTVLDAESLADSGSRESNDEPRRETGIGSIVNREAHRTTDVASTTATNARPELMANPLLAPRKPTTDEPAELPRVYENRKAPHKAEIVAAQGGSPGTEAAVRAALQWLAANQDDDGRWDASRFGAGRDRAVPGKNLRMVGVDSDNGVTGLALLAFLGNGHTHLEGEYREPVERGLQFLLSTQKPNGNLSGGADDFAAMYCHGMAALAVSEAYAMTQDERLLDPVRKAIKYTLAAQHPTAGGWRYKPGDPVCDTSQLGWQLMALKSAELAGIEIPDRSRQGMLRFLKSVSSGRHGGLASYRPMSLRGEQVSASMTAEALVCRQFLGLERSDPACDEAGNLIVAALPGRGPNNFYYWYYATLGMFQLQGKYWDRWKNALEPTLIATQRTEGSLSGSWDPDPLWGGHGGRVYSTALGALCLEVYYRFLPLYVQASEAGK